MTSIFLSAAIMGGLGLFFGTVLAVAYRFLHVAEDPRLEAVETLLPGSNCGACGEPGCRALAEKLTTGETTPSKCTVADPEAVQTIAALLGVDAGQPEKRVARLHCAGGRAQALQIAAYEGMPSCAAASVVSDGGKGCVWGCLGLADCVRACTFDAITLNANGLPVVGVDKCTACGDCVTACPRDLFEILPLDHHLFVQCSAPLGGPAIRALCGAACDACGRCVEDAPAGLIRMRDNLPLIDYARGGPALPDATFRCPTGAIQWLTREQFEHSALPTDELRHAAGY